MRWERRTEDEWLLWDDQGVAVRRVHHQHYLASPVDRYVVVGGPKNTEHATLAEARRAAEESVRVQ